MRSAPLRTIRLPIVLMAAAIAAVASAAPTQAVEKVRLAQNQSPISGVSIIADRKGFFAQNGLDVEVFKFTTGKQCLDTVMGGGADIATTAEAPTTAAAMSGQKIALLARTEYSYIKTLTATAAQIRKPADLKGKRIAFTAGTGGEVYTMQLLKAARLGKDDVTLVNLRPQDMVAALASGSIDAYGTWEPHIFNGIKALASQVALDDQTLDILNAHASWRLASGNHPPGAVMPDWRTVIYSEPLKAVAPDKVMISY